MIVEIDDFGWQSANPLKCFVLNRPRQAGEKAFRIGMIDEERGTLDISEAAVTQMAQMCGWKSPEEYEELEVANEVQHNQLLAMKEDLIAAGKLSPDIRQLVHDLDLAEAVRDDAIAQFQAAEDRVKELELEVETLTELLDE